jgi:hypothetical protein
MPWQPDGTFLRINPDYTGNVWDKDQKADIKVIATRHDFHDQDLADGIARCLNIDGYNKMFADLDMNNYKIINAAQGTGPNDLVTFNQLLDTMTFDDPTRTLTLSSPAGQILTAVIPSGSGGGGEGTVTSIDIGEGLDGTVTPIVTSGDIKLATIGTGQSYSGGIGAITIDKHGRVTSVTGNSGGGGSIVLGSTRSSTSVTIRDENNTSNNAVIAAATTSFAGVMTAAMRSDLNDAVAGIPEPGLNTGDMLYWGIADQWERTALISAFGSEVTISGTLDLNGPLEMANYDILCDELGAKSMRLSGTFPAIFFNDTGASGDPNFAVSADGGQYMYILGAGSTSDSCFRYQKASSSSNDITALSARNGAVFEGTVTAQLNSYMTIPEREAMIDLLETNGVLTAPRATAIKALLAADIAQMIADDVTVQRT